MVIKRHETLQTSFTKMMIMKLLLLFLVVMCSMSAESRVLSPDQKNHLLVRKTHRLLLVKKETPPNTKHENMATRPINKAMVEDSNDEEEEEEEGKRSKYSPFQAVLKTAKEDIRANISSIKGKLMRGEMRALVAELIRDVSEIVRRMQGLVYVTVNYVMPNEMAGAVASATHLLGFVTAYGACVWVLLVWRRVVPMALPRQQLGLVQARVYPVYFKLVAFGVGVAFVSRYSGTELRPLKEKFPGYNLVAVLLLVLANMLFLEPKVTKLVMEKMKEEKEEGRGGEDAEPELEKSVERKRMKSKVGELDNELKRISKHSVFLDILTLVGLTVHLVHLAQRLQACHCPNYEK